MTGTPIRVLGSIRLDGDTGEQPVGGPLAERLLGALVVARGNPVPTARLTEILWPEQPDRDAGPALRMAAARLRRRLEGAGLPDPIAGGDRSYRLSVAHGCVDIDRFETLVDRANGLHDTDAGEAIAVLEAALAHWRGEPFGDLGNEDWAAGACAQLLELRHTAEERLADLELRRGREALLLPRLRLWVEEAPLRERRWGQLAVALYRSGRQGEALRALDEARQTLREQLGIDPGADLRRIEQAILDQDGAALGIEAVTSRDAPQVVSLVGRDEDIEEVARLLHTNPLVTVHGLGGVGKSSLARVVAERCPDRALAWASLESADRLDDVWLITALAVGIVGADDPAALPDAVAHRLGLRPTLLVLDGAEEVAHAAADVADSLLTRIQDLAILVLSRIPLGASREVRYALDPLPVGTAGEPGPAVQLFIDRAGMAPSQLDATAREHIVSVCSRVAGLPMAIELSAASADRSGLAVLASGTSSPAADAVRTALDWTIDTLSPESRGLLEVAALLPGGLSRRVAASLAPPGTDAGPLLAPLLQARLMHARAARSGPRYDVLPSLQDLVGERVPVSPRTGVSHTVVEHLRDLGRAARSPGRRPSVSHLIELEDELLNIRRWLRRSLGTTMGLELAVAVAPALADLGLGVESSTWVRQHTDAAPDAGPLLLAEAAIARLGAQGIFPVTAANPPELEAAAVVAAEHGSWRLWLSITSNLAIALAFQGDVGRAQGLVDDPETVQRVVDLDDPWLLATFRAFRAMPLIVRGSFAEARAELEGLATELLAADDPSGALQVLYGRAWLARAAGDREGREVDLAHAREISVGTRAAGTRALLAAEIAHRAFDAGDSDAVGLLEVAVDELVSTGQLRAAAGYRRDLAVWRFQGEDHAGAAANLRDALPTLLRSDRVGAAMAAARLAQAIQSTSPSQAARLAATASALQGEGPERRAPQPDLDLIQELATTIGAAAATRLTDGELLDLVAEMARS